ncbi:MAG: DUF3164 family protein [Rhizobiales bacterium]|nr:DUF3164 family protein [Hyphomicrobiales bacterium]
MEAQIEAPAAPWSDGITEIGGKKYMTDAKGALMPLALVETAEKLEDEMVRKIIYHAKDLSDRVARFKGHTFDDICSLQALLEQEYGAPAGGKKGNITFESYDGLMKVQVKVANVLEFGSRLQVAKKLVDACLSEWAEDSRDEIRAIVNRAFQVDNEGTVNRSEIFMLLRVAIEDERWKRAMDAIRDSIRVIGTKTYFHFFERESLDGEWTAIPISLARA